MPNTLKLEGQVLTLQCESTYVQFPRTDFICNQGSRSHSKYSKRETPPKKAEVPYHESYCFAAYIILF
jgi:hypothetical protein